MDIDLLILIARILLMTLFVMTGWQKLTGFAGTVGYMRSLGHRFWTMQGDKRHENFLNFFKNVSIAGGLILLAVAGPGRYALIGG